jgi:fucose 4-O-acetylase-like acetyltransferase
MDRAVYATRLDRLLFMKIQPRTFRWIPLLVIAALVTGYVMMAKTASSPNRGFFIGLMLFYGAFLVANFLRVFGPRFLGTVHHPLDERELMVKARAYALCGIVITSFAMIGCFYMAGAGLVGLWQPKKPNDWITLGFGIQAGALLLPTWIASWQEPRPIPDQKD